jgi:uncharacterized repeat protein (TIGR03803 family)
METKSIRAIVVISVVTLILLIAPTAQGRETVLHAFQGKAKSPAAALVADGSGNLFGTTGQDGLSPNTVYELSPLSGGGWSFRILHVFKPQEGQLPQGRLVLDSGRNLFGTTAGGGKNGCGTVYELSPQSGGRWSEATLHDFVCTDSSPAAELVFDGKGNLFGGTINFSSGAGVAFELTPASQGQWTYNVLHRFTGAGDPGPQTSLIFDANGNLYGGQNFAIFVLTPNSDGSWTKNTAYKFSTKTDGSNPQGDFVFDNAGNLYGANGNDGSHGQGTVFKLTPHGGGWTSTVLHSFAAGHDGSGPAGGVIFDAAGNLEGTTSYGGAHGVGTVFKLTPGAHGRWTETLLHTFTGGRDGSQPFAGLLLQASGNLFGTTSKGGAKGLGVLFEIAP